MSKTNSNKMLIISVILVLILILVFKLPEYIPLLGKATLLLQIPSPRIDAGSQLKLDILADGVADLAGVQMSIVYNPSVLKYVSTAEGNFLNQNGAAQTFFLNTINTLRPDVVDNIAIVKVGNGVSGNGIIATVYFNATAAGYSDLTFNGVLLSDSNGNPISAGIINTNVSIATIGVNSSITVLPPVLRITYPVGGSTISGSTVKVIYTKSGDLTGVDHANLQLDTRRVVSDLDFDGNYQFTNVASGKHTLKAYLARADNSKVSGTDVKITFRTRRG